MTVFMSAEGVSSTQTTRNFQDGIRLIRVVSEKKTVS